MPFALATPTRRRVHPLGYPLAAGPPPPPAAPPPPLLPAQTDDFISASNAFFSTTSALVSHSEARPCTFRRATWHLHKQTANATITPATATPPKTLAIAVIFSFRVILGHSEQLLLTSM